MNRGSLVLIGVLFFSRTGTLLCLDPPRFMPEDPPLILPFKADPLEFRSGVRFLSSDASETFGALRSGDDIGTSLGVRSVMYQFPLNEEMPAQVLAMALGQGRFDSGISSDMIAEDWRYGLAFLTRYGGWSYGLELLHHSTHAGDEYLERQGSFKHISYTRESVGLRGAYDWSPKVRTYYSAEYGIRESHAKNAFGVSAGLEYYLEPRYFPGGLGPYVAVDLRSSTESDNKVTASTVLGYAFPSFLRGRSLDLQLFHVTGPTPMRAFYNTTETYSGYGITIDL